jgi:2-oxoglutarate ferredoxin oxidoreductase subunit beta
MAFLEAHRAKNEIVTGVLYATDDGADVHELNETATAPLVSIPYDRLCPGSAALAELQESFR